MGKAIILTDSDFSGYNLGVVHRVTIAILPAMTRITEATIFRVEKDGVQLTDVSWSVNDPSKASVVANSNGTCTVTPLTATTIPVLLTANCLDGVLTQSILATTGTPTFVWYIDRCLSNPSRGSLNNANLVNGGWAYMSYDNALLQGRKINRVRIIPSVVGVFNIYKAYSVGGATTKVAEFTIASSQVGIETVYEFPEFYLDTNEVFVFGNANSVGGFKYYQDTQNGHNGVYSKVPSSPTHASTNPEGTMYFDLNISVGYYGVL